MVCIGLIVTIIVGKANQGKIKYDKYTELTAAVGQEYTTVDEYGNEYDVKEDGMYCKTNYGYVKVNYGKPLDKYNTYTYILENGTSHSFELHKDGTYDYTCTYSDGGGYRATGDYIFKFGIDNAFDALKITEASDFEDAFMFSSAVINPNDLFVVTLKTGKITYFNSDNENVTYIEEGDNSGTDTDTNSENSTNNSVLDEMVIYLYKDTDDTIKASAYDTISELLFNKSDINGHINVKTE